MCQKADKAWAKLEDRWERDWALPTGTKWRILAMTGKMCSILSMAKEVIVLNKKMKRAQINTERLASMFEVTPVTTWCDKDQKQICELFFKVLSICVFKPAFELK